MASMRTSTTGKLNSRGFTLVELLVVIALFGIMLAFAVPSTRDVLTTDDLKKASRRLIGLERQLRADAVRDQVDYILVLNIPEASYYVITPDMTPEKRAEIEKLSRKLAGSVTIADVVNYRNEKISEGLLKIKFGKNNVSPPLIIHLAEEDRRMTLVINPFLGVTAVHDGYVDIRMEDGLGKDRKI